LDDIVDDDGINDVEEEGKVALGFVAMVVLVILCKVRWLLGLRPKRRKEMN
jgi:Ni/Fe-hydrogenase subunit HybB-like protein